MPYWKERFNKKSHEENLNRLGNLTLTTGPENSKLSNKGFDEKKLIFKESDWKINQLVSHCNDWNEKQIEKRSKELFKFAMETGVGMKRMNNKKFYNTILIFIFL